MDFWGRLDGIRERWNVLHHPFYERWSRGELTREQLAFYAEQYWYAVVALARACEAACRVAPDLALWDELETHAAEERRHVELWDDFVEAVGGDRHAAPTSRTEVCVDVWAPPRDRPFLRVLAALYVIEAAQPAISVAKAEALARFYGVADRRALAYFEVHERLDVKHAEHSRASLALHLVPEKEDAVLAEAERALRANWLLLDGVEARAVAA